eukprot:6209572-Pleurochrysis_carterae.AAC.1
MEVAVKCDDPKTDKAVTAEHAGVAVRSGHAPVKVVVGTSCDISAEFVREICLLINEAYGHMRVSTSDVKNRLRMGDAGPAANRVLHLAFREGKLVGCCSSTVQPPWTERGCGHWGLLSVDPAVQGTGVASALVAAAESRLADSRCVAIQIEYEFTPGDAYSERLLAWYEGKCGFVCSSGPPRGRWCEFRKCRKQIPLQLRVKPPKARASASPIDKRSSSVTRSASVRAQVTTSAVKQPSDGLKELVARTVQALTRRCSRHSSGSEASAEFHP